MPTGELVSVNAGPARSRKVDRCVKFQDCKKTDWKYEINIAPSTKAYSICYLLMFLSIVLIWGMHVSVLSEEYRDMFVALGIVEPRITPVVTTTTTEPPPNTTVLVTTTTPTTTSAGEIIHTKTTTLRAGAAIADMLGPPVELQFMGYDMPDSKGQGIHTRQYARTFCFGQSTKKIVYVVADLYAIGYGLRSRVIQGLRNSTSGKVYSIYNVHIQATGTHSTPGSHIAEYIFGAGPPYSEECMTAYVDGIRKSIDRACATQVPAFLFLAYGEVYSAQLNRSPKMYELNPSKERDRFPLNYDHYVTQLRIENKHGNIIGLINWFAQHSCSLGRKYPLVSTDNFGYAAIKMEKLLNPGKLVGEAKIVTAFAPSNHGDVSPNINGGKCDGHNCFQYRQCSKSSICKPQGPGSSPLNNAEIIGSRIYDGAKEALDQIGDTLDDILEGTYRVLYSYGATGTKYDPIAQVISEDTYTLCDPHPGVYFYDGSFDMERNGEENNAVKKSSESVVPDSTHTKRSCMGNHNSFRSHQHGDKVPMYPNEVTINMLNFGGLMVGGMPGEPTTMAGRRMRAIMKLAMTEKKVKPRVVIASNLNEYINSFATKEEYSSSQSSYEGDTTFNGPDTLSMVINLIYEAAHEAAMATTKVRYSDAGLEGEDQHHAQARNVYTRPPLNMPPEGKEFFDVVTQPSARVARGGSVSCVLIGTNPRCDLRHEGSYMLVERKSNDQWIIIARDAEWETTFQWNAQSMYTTATWNVPKVAELGSYRFRVFGNTCVSKREYLAVSNEFTVTQQ